MRMNHEDKRSDKTRQALTSAFVQLMLEDGYEAVTVQRVAARARVGRSTFYLHFSDKRALLRRSLTAPSTQLLRLVCEPVEPRDLAPQLSTFTTSARAIGCFSSSRFARYGRVFSPT